MRVESLLGPLILLVALTASADQDVYQVGVGIGDCTGPAAQINMMGYAKLGQDTHGLHLRQFARAFIIGDNDTRVVIVSVDAGMISQILKMEVVRVLGEKYNGLYTNHNVLVSGTHTHSTPGGFFQYTLFDITSSGFINQTFEALLNGVVASIDQAHKNMQPAYIFYGQDTLLNASANRSPASYLENPKEERDRYDDNTDKTVSMLKFVDLDGNPIGLLDWFAVHCTSMNNTNELISSDNKGYAALLVEMVFNNGTIGKGPFVAGFPNANEGDSSPNTEGAKCIDTGLPCDFTTSTCDGRNELCIASGPGKDMLESTEIIAKKQFVKAMDMFNNAKEPVHGKVQFISENVNMSSYPVHLDDGTNVTTCQAGLGHAFGAGTTDGPGMFDFHQATREGQDNYMWNLVRNILKVPNEEYLKCHLPKPVLLPTGLITNPVPWHPEVVQTQMFRIGNIVLVALPGEFTTMSGRRVREAVEKTLKETPSWTANDTHVVLQGLSNIYTHYIATFEEYQLQRYEGASTIYGPHTQLAYQQQFQKLAKCMANGDNVPDPLQPPNYLKDQFSLVMDPLFDTSPPGVGLGEVIVDAEHNYEQGDEVSVQFSCGNPRNNLMTDETFLAVEKLDSFTDTGSYWQVVATDAHWETRFYWMQVSLILQQSVCTIVWDIPLTATLGTYRIRHLGYAHPIFGSPFMYNTTSRLFNVTNPSTTLYRP